MDECKYDSIAKIDPQPSVSLPDNPTWRSVGNLRYALTCIQENVHCLHGIQITDRPEFYCCGDMEDKRLNVALSRVLTMGFGEERQ